jgi:hypothetical protein
VLGLQACPTMSGLVIFQMAHTESSGEDGVPPMGTRPLKLVLAGNKMPNFLKYSQKLVHDLSSANGPCLRET